MNLDKIDCQDFDNILAFGDSFVAGAELDGPTSQDVKHKAFPAILGRMLNKPVYNFGWGGGSNQRSLRLLPEKLLEYPNSLILFFYSDHSRNEYFRPDLPSHLPTDSTGYSPLGSPWSHPCIESHSRELNNLFYKNFYRDSTEYNNYKEYNTLLTVQLFCEKFAKNYVQIFGFANIIPTKVNEQTKLLDVIDTSKLLKFPGDTWEIEGWNLGYGNLIEWVKNNNFPVGISHMLHEGHQALADLIYTHLTKK